MTSTTLSIRPEQTTFTPEQKTALRQMGADKATDGDLALFFHQCKATGLDPFRRQIYLIGRYDSRSGGTKYATQTSIDGYRIVAARTGTLAGIEETWSEDANGKIRSATVVVRKVVAGHVCEFSAVAHWDEYVQTTKDGKPMGLWSKLPHRMLAKCAEANALRRAFPDALGGIYTAEEMPDEQPAPHVAHAANEAAPDDDTKFQLEPSTASPEPTDKPITAAQTKRIHAQLNKLGVPDEKYRERLRSLYDVDSSKHLTHAQAADLIKRLESAGPQS